ncbi:aromatic amino acid exporter YddG [Nioella nitratireducens]|uniref:aromatic amino acid exporter YddG n=1 Tax=Nioella nitratireducens TaxID=1287720 RepID=UPI0008FD45E7|nr:EamA family transporter [Nioella nitratireducens]
MSRNMATAVGFVAVLLWALLAYFTAASGQVPPFQLTAMSFGIGGLSGILTWIVRPQGPRALRQPLKVWALGVGGLFGYHLLYFTALRNAPTVDASLIAFLWPLLIVLFSALAPGERLRLHHVAGAVMGFAGAALIVTRGQGLTLNPDYAFGYSLALLAALFWSSYSVLSRRFAEVPTDVVTGFCLVTALLATGAHLMLEDTVWPATTGEWLAVIGLGVGPVGLAFFVWDIGVKRGDIQVLGAASYSAPLLSTLLLIALGESPATWAVAGACLLITLGATVAAKDMLFRRRARAAVQRVKPGP